MLLKLALEQFRKNISIHDSWRQLPRLSSIWRLVHPHDAPELNSAGHGLQMYSYSKMTDLCQ